MSPAMRFTLVHSPLVGPATWSAVAEALGAAGHEVAVPSLLDAAAAGTWGACVDAAAGQACGGEGRHALVGHSGAGPLLPVIAARLPHPPDQLVFIDAGVPPDSGEARLVPEAFADHLQALAVDGLLPPWSAWFGDGAMEALVADRAVREAVVQELPRLPLTYFADLVPMPEGWADTDGAYIRLSEAYAEDEAAAAAHGWPTARIDGQHLDILDRSCEITGLLVALTS